jgi:hypothetical protein
MDRLNPIQLFKPDHSMKKIYLLTALCLSFFSMVAQEFPAVKTIPVKKGDTLSITLQRLSAPRGVKGLFKTLFTAAAAYQLNQSIDNNGNGKLVRANKAIAPAIGAGLLVGYKDLIPQRGKQQSFIHYAFFKSDSQLLTNYKAGLRNGTSTIKEIATEDGYVNVVLFPGRKERFSVDVTVHSGTAPLEPTYNQQLKGSIVQSFKLQSFDECLPPVIVVPCDPASEWYDVCTCIPGFCDPGPCDTDPTSCECDIAYCGPPDPCSQNPWSCECDMIYCECYTCECDPSLCEPPPVNPGPCNDAMKAAAANTTNFYNTKIDPLIIPELAMVGTWPNEMAFTIEDANGQNHPEPYASDVAMGTSNADTVTVTDQSLAIAHTHPAGGYPPPSATDLYTIMDTYNDYQKCNYSFVYAADGSLYALQVTDPAAMATFLANYPPATYLDNTTHNFVEGTPLKADFNTAFAYLTAGGMSANEAYGKAMAFVFDKYGAGVTMQKADANHNFSTVLAKGGRDANGNLIILTEDCN